MIKRALTKFAEKPISYFFLIGCVVCLFGPHPDQFLLMGIYIAALGGAGWYFLKAIFIAGSTVKNWDVEHPGEPMFKPGGLTAYDAELARQVGEAAGRANRRN